MIPRRSHTVQGCRDDLGVVEHHQIAGLQQACGGLAGGVLAAADEHAGGAECGREGGKA